MPLLLTRRSKYKTCLAAWKVTEDDDFFLKALELSDPEMEVYQKMRPHRKKEWLSSRYLLNLISGDSSRKTILKKADGKPYRKDCNKHISLSHSKNLVAAIISEKPVGIDIQNFVEKISRIAHKFVSPQESLHIPENENLQYYHVFWGAKECMYKAYGLKKLEFKDHMHLYPFKLCEGATEFKGFVQKDEIRQDYELEMEKVENAFLVHCRLSE